jgi:radical SAM superfamily enzyme YgiQ (UPF0313 family)
MVLAVIISVVTTFTPLGHPVKNFVAGVEKMTEKECQIIRKNIDKHHVVECVKIKEVHE